MNEKHFVNWDTAKALRAAGYNEDIDHCINEDGEIMEVTVLNQDLPEWKCQCPSIQEALDWLEERDVRIEVRMKHMKIKGDPYKVADDDEYQWQYFYDICKGDDVENPIIACDESDCVIMYTDRNLCWQEAVEKGVSVL